VNSFKNTLLASSVLTTVGFGASATTLIEGVPPAPADFPNTPPGTPVDFSMFQSVQGFLSTLNPPPDLSDFFTFTGLTVGDDFSIMFSNTTESASLLFAADADGISETLAAGTSKTDTGVLSSTSLGIGVTVVNGQIAGGFGEGYTVALSEFPAGVPEPSAAAIFAVGLAGLGVARHRRRR
jgi:hypothetical protein